MFVRKKRGPQIGSPGSGYFFSGLFGGSGLPKIIGPIEYTGCPGGSDPTLITPWVPLALGVGGKFLPMIIGPIDRIG